jgi:hypothetical protein
MQIFHTHRQMYRISAHSFNLVDEFQLPETGKQAFCSQLHYHSSLPLG